MSDPAPVSRGSLARRFAALFGLGAVGVIALIPTIIPAVERQLGETPELELSVPVLALLSLVNPLLLLALAVGLGIRYAPRVGLRSYLDDRMATGEPIGPRLRGDLRIAIIVGAIGGATLLLLEFALQPLLADAFEGFTTERGWEVTLAGLLYGGITEELLIRWGLMTLIAWLAWRAVGLRGASPGAGVMWTAIGISAVIFGAGHLPALAAAVPLTPILVVRTIALNAIGGVLFGWLFWRRSLEAAMIAHATFHVVFTAYSLVT